MKKTDNIIPLTTINKQRVSPPEYDSNGHLKVHSIFSTIQGEGPFAGQPAIFIRLGGCNLRCPACDTEYTKGSVPMALHQICDEVKRLTSDNKTTLVVITGGEPFRQYLLDLCDELLGCKFEVQIETNGTLSPYGNLNKDISAYKVYGILMDVTVVCSPKTEFVHPDLLPHISAYKYVLDRNDISDDGLPVKALGHKVRDRLYRPDNFSSVPIYLQAIDVQNDIENRLHVQEVVRQCLKHGYILCLQVHKIINVE